MHRIFMAVGLNRFGRDIGLIDMVGKAARVDSPAIRFGFALNNHFSQ